MKFYKILFLHTLIFGTLLSISSYSWFSMWMGLEINLLSMIPLLTSKKNIYPSESTFKYFITQALASSILLFSIIMILNLSEFFPQNSLLTVMMNSALLTKMGAAPFHSWFPEVMEGLDWWNCLILLTWQKIAPLILLAYNLSISLFLSCIIIFSSLTGGILGLNQISLRKILAYSSINHIGWMLASLQSLNSTWLIYFLVYSIISMNIILIFNQMNIFFLKQLTNIMNLSKMFKYFFILNFLSLGGLPPFLGFFPKWLTINFLIYSNLSGVGLVLIISTLLTLLFYLRLMLSSLIFNTEENMIFSMISNNWLIIFFNLLSLIGLLLCMMVFSIF
nr:NADH dehydrogenase subunit 2 [Mantitheus pekinensis]